jgi:hypothetical protein
MHSRTEMRDVSLNHKLLAYWFAFARHWIPLALVCDGTRIICDLGEPVDRLRLTTGPGRDVLSD